MVGFLRYGHICRLTELHMEGVREHVVVSLPCHGQLSSARQCLTEEVFACGASLYGHAGKAAAFRYPMLYCHCFKSIFTRKVNK